MLAGQWREWPVGEWRVAGRRRVGSLAIVDVSQLVPPFLRRRSKSAELTLFGDAAEIRAPERDIGEKVYDDGHYDHDTHCHCVVECCDCIQTRLRLRGRSCLLPSPPPPLPQRQHHHEITWAPINCVAQSRPPPARHTGCKLAQLPISRDSLRNETSLPVRFQS